MKIYIWVTFGFMGWAYYEMSGGADFAPEQRQVAAVEVIEPEQTPEIVTRSETTTLLSVSSSNVAPQPAPTAVDLVKPATVELEPEVVVADVEPKLDLRDVAGSRVNMRMGPSTDFDVITTLTGGTQLEVLDVNEAGWANVRTVDRGIEGWMAERLLTEPQL